MKLDSLSILSLSVFIKRILETLGSLRFELWRIVIRKFLLKYLNGFSIWRRQFPVYSLEQKWNMSFTHYFFLCLIYPFRVFFECFQILNCQIKVWFPREIISSKRLFLIFLTRNYLCEYLHKNGNKMNLYIFLHYYKLYHSQYNNYIQNLKLYFSNFS